MVCRWLDGAELWGNSTKTGRAYLSSTNGYDAGDFRIAPGTRALTSNDDHMTTPSLSVQNTWIIGFGLKVPSSPAGWEWRFLSGASEQLRLETTDNGGTFEIRIMRGATQIAITSQTFSENVWHYFEFKVTLTNTGSYELRHNEQNVLSDAGPVDLQELGSAGADGHSWFHSPSGNTFKMDDIYILDDTGSVNDDFLGDTVLFELKPNGDESVQWSPEPAAPATNFDKVDEAGDVTSDSDWVESNTNGHTDYYEFANAPATGIGTIHAVKVSYNGRLATAGSATLRSKFKNSGGSTANGDDVVFAGTSFVELPVIFDQEPVATATWTASALNGGRFGLEKLS